MAPAVTDAERQRLRQRPRALPVMRQLWRHLGFFHWTVDAAALAALLPPGLGLDTFDGQAYVGLVPFTIIGTRPPFLPALPGFSDFHEVNVRTYVHRRGQEPGVWFFSLDAQSRLAVAGARLVYKLPYFYADMSMDVRAGDARPSVVYRSRRVQRGGGDGPRLDCIYRPTGPVLPAVSGSLEFFLAERYLLYSWDGRRLRSARVHHAPYPLQVAEVSELDETLVAASGLRPPAPGAEPPLCHYAREVDVRIYRPRSVAGT